MADNFDPKPELVCSPPSGSLFPIGTTEVVCVATDSSGNKATRSFKVIVTTDIGPTREWVALLPDQAEG